MHNGKGGVLGSHVGTRSAVRIDRNRPGDPRVNGYVLGTSGVLALLHVFDDFEPDGYSVIRLEDVVAVRSDEHERLWDRMLGEESLLSGLEKMPRVDLASMRRAVETASQEYGTIILECEEEEVPLEDFYFGRVLGFEGESVRFRPIDSLGFWAREPELIDVSKITQVRFDTPYIRRFSKYVREKPRM